jgi:hypothetical protein
MVEMNLSDTSINGQETKGENMHDSVLGIWLPEKEEGYCLFTMVSLATNRVQFYLLPKVVMGLSKPVLKMASMVCKMVSMVCKNNHARLNNGHF